MGSFFKRIFTLGKAEANSIIDSLENPVKMTEQGIRDLKTDLEKAMKAYAEVKAVCIRSKRDMETGNRESSDWERKAMALLQQGQLGKTDNSEAESLATEALTRKEESTKRFLLAKQAYESQNSNAEKMKSNIDMLKKRISQFENELITLKARAKTAKATSVLNKQLSSFDSNGTLSLLERMKEKVEEEEALALAYGDINQPSLSLDDKINQTLIEDKSSGSGSLLALKEKMGIQ